MFDPATRYTRGPASRTANRRGAFTLVELVIVVLLVSILATMAVPSVSEAFSDMQLRTCAQRTTSDIAHVRNLAVTNGEQRGIVFNSSGYSVVKLSANSREVMDHPIKHQAWTVSESEVSFLADFDDESVLTFDGTGAPSSAGTVMLTSNGRTITITVQAGTGRTSVSE
jgi:type II secretion system protein H